MVEGDEKVLIRFVSLSYELSHDVKAALNLSIHRGADIHHKPDADRGFSGRAAQACRPFERSEKGALKLRLLDSNLQPSSVSGS